MANIVVLVKRVPDTNARIVVNGNQVDLSAVKWVISPYDEFAIENALQHREAHGGSVTALTLGPSDADKVLKDAKAIGVDEIVRVWDDSWGELDSNGVQIALTEAITNLNADVVYCGKNAADTGAGSTGPGIAERLGWASVSNISDVSFDGGVTVTAPADGGSAKISLPTNVVISCDKGSVKVRKPNVKGIMMAKRSQVNVVSASAPSASITFVSHSPPPAKPAGKKYEGASSANEVAKLLRDEANVI
ncbi:MAG: electron transfer flavoprotein subunit beta/FixA family protein [Candidatus Poseidoniaceae archaeon]|jgi:electron transfer flavoprotein beta subunit|nr:electron transfer flavoprotein subunit beta/FixA family protein [Candidatus Poseidoniaceae archaeon]